MAPAPGEPLVTINTAGGRCDVFVGSEILKYLNDSDALRNASGVALITDRNTDRLFRKMLEPDLRAPGRAFTRASISPGEKSKNLRTAGNLLELMASGGMDRSAVVVGVGGGVVTDMAGFVASVFMRGIPWIAVPTTLLGMVDASIGGKTGVDLRAGKNLAGTFHPPRAVFSDISTLLTLEPRDVAGGLAEVIKIALACDGALFRDLASLTCRELAPGSVHLHDMIRRSILCKSQIVMKDERDAGARMALNLGHTTAHALESATRFDRFHHGEAVAIGLVVACLVSARRGLVAKNVSNAVCDLLLKYKLPAAWPADLEPAAVLPFALLDKKNKAGALRMVLPTQIGGAVVETIAPGEWLVAAKAAGNIT